MTRHLPGAEGVVVTEQYESADQQMSANRMGMWVFLASELMLFGGFFLGFLVYRVMHPQGFTEAVRHTDLLIGTVNTAVLLTSSLTVALAVTAVRHGRRGMGVACLAATVALGVAFLALKGYEYWKEYGEGLMPHAGKPFPLHEEGTMLFFNLYFAATGLHAAHLTLGIVMMATIAVLWALRGTARVPELVESGALYWHLIDVIWIWLYPLIYLAGR